MDMTAVLSLTQEGYSRRQIARMLGVSRNTLKKYLNPTEQKTGGLFPGGKLHGYLSDMSSLLQEKPQVRAVEVFRRLRERGYSGSYDLVKRKVRALRWEKNSGVARSAAPGQRAEVELGRVEAAGRARYLFSMVLIYSGRIYAELLDQIDLDAFLSCHQKALRFFQGAPREVEYERNHNKLLKRLAGGARFHLPLVRFADHWGFSPRDGEPYSPWAAGRLKRPVRLIENLFLRTHAMESLESANTALLNWLLGRESDPQSRNGESIREKYAREFPCLGKLPKLPYVGPRLKMIGTPEI